MYAEGDLALRSARDVLGAEFGAVIVDDREVQRRLVNYLRAVAPELASRVRLYDAGMPLFEKYGLESQLKKTLSRRVELPSGGYIVIDHTEAMTVIDVNTGRYVGRRMLEETIVKTNVEACREIVRQLRLRDIGGIIVIDFIDMSVRTNQEAVLKALESELQQDRTKTYVVEISPLGPGGDDSAKHQQGAARGRHHAVSALPGSRSRLFRGIGPHRSGAAPALARRVDDCIGAARGGASSHRLPTRRGLRPAARLHRRGDRTALLRGGSYRYGASRARGGGA